ncbi:MAG: GNAT family N-acetyltransferase [Actinobacteria bacterium]|nr:GNAT family N-acetyltransferase [Actinomycetota bacterium]
MIVDARHATTDDIEDLVRLYRGLESEMTDLHPMWPLADGLNEPVADSLRDLLADPDTAVLIGQIDGYPFGFLVARVEGLLAQAGDVRVGAIRLVYVDEAAREVGVGEIMRDMAVGALRERGIARFDAHVLPGHRLAKNFFESGGFSARSIIMHHDDDRE